MAYSNNDLVEDLLPHFESEFKQRYEAMNPEDVSKYYYCFTRANRYGSGHFYKYLQKALSKTIRRFESGNVRLMFTDWQHAENRLNKGVRGRIHDRLFYLMDRKQMDGFDVKAIWEETRVPGERPDELNAQCRTYLERIKYF